MEHSLFGSHREYLHLPNGLPKRTNKYSPDVPTSWFVLHLTTHSWHRVVLRVNFRVSCKIHQLPVCECRSLSPCFTHMKISQGESRSARREKEPEVRTSSRSRVQILRSCAGWRKGSAKDEPRHRQEHGTGIVRRDEGEGRDRLAGDCRCFASTNASSQRGPQETYSKLKFFGMRMFSAQSYQLEGISLAVRRLRSINNSLDLEYNALFSCLQSPGSSRTVVRKAVLLEGALPVLVLCCT